MLDNLDRHGVVDFGYVEGNEPESFERYEFWEESGYAEPLTYLTDHRKDLRKDILKVYPEFSSALVFLFSYADVKKSCYGKIAGFARAFEGKDYHHVLKDRLDQILDEIKNENDKIDGKIVVDTHPILERDLAYRAGLGWFGKNSMLINKRHGSFTMIGSILLNSTLEIEKKEVVKDLCGTCKKCVFSCPTASITNRRTVDCEKCISSYTAEVFKDEEAPFDYKSGEYFFGCDICQDVCPWNEKALKNITKITAVSELDSFFKDRDEAEIRNEIESMSNSGYKNKFKGTSLERVGKAGFLKNLVRKSDDK